MNQRNFLPGARAWNVILVLGGFALGWAIYMRYALVEQSAVGLACLGVETGSCIARRTVIELFGYSAFGIAALATSIIQLIRPSIPMFTLALMATAAGLVMYNNNLSGVAAGLLLISFARPWRGARD
ncbi:hypothetical protein [Ancylobacter defluvii]|uniref:Uncharacterized protein n=1 Tax=Ancylobacter defluvii TaxID=1282440 RepID=A0A9W6K147_9HYPH|nr:hypothetical protein [Ancylobacter defluvii]MBS7587011.1 hypothetical protein [Ancylobacter defluvii]GLK86316.1 hypothetical protein GCM10017653_43860 [Ancylobacter defluvii]